MHVLDAAMIAQLQARRPTADAAIELRLGAGFLARLAAAFGAVVLGVIALDTSSSGAAQTGTVVNVTGRAQME